MENPPVLRKPNLSALSATDSRDAITRQILEKSPNTRIFLTRRRHIVGEIDRRLGERGRILFIKPKHGDTVGYIRIRLSNDISLDRMGDGLEDEMIHGITDNIPEA